MTLDAAVVDASIAAAWLMPDEASDASRAAFARVRSGSLELHAPELWLWECGNVIANAVKRRRMTAPDALLMWSVLDALRVRVELVSPEPAQVRAALTLAIDHGLSLYDAGYLWLASSLRLPLLSADARLVAACKARSIRVVDFGDLA